MDARPDADLACAARAGDRRAFSAIYERYAATVHGVLLAGVSHQDAGDLVQDVFAAALGAIHTLTEPERLAGWLCTIARNRARDHARRSRPNVALDDVALEGVAQETASPSSSATSMDLDAGSIAQDVLAAIRALPEAYREPLVLRLVEGLTGPEIADRTGKTHGSLRVNLHRGMKLLREELERRGLSEVDG